MSRYTERIIPATLVALGMLAVAASPVQAGPKATRISGQSLIAADCLAGGVQSEAEVEPMVVADPRDPPHLVAVWQQDRYEDSSGARGLGVATSSDAGRSWHPSVVKGMTTCTGGADERASYPWASVGPDGAIYLAAMTFQKDGQDNPDGDPNAIVVATSPDRGRSWSNAVDVVRGVSTQQPVVAADPNLAGTAYIIWSQANYFSCALIGCRATDALLFARTDDHGANWSPPAPVRVHPPLEWAAHSKIVVLGDGALLVVYTHSSPYDPPAESAENCLAGGDGPCRRERVSAQRSDDGGRTWSAPVSFAEGEAIGLEDPEEPDAETGLYAEIGGSKGWQPHTQVGPDGTVFVAWPNHVFRTPAPDGRKGEIHLASSSDGGRTWSSAAVIASTTRVFQSALAVRSDGTLGVTWYDFLSDRLGDDQLSVDVWFASSDDRGASWARRRIAGPFDMRSAPRTRIFGRPDRLFLGEYQGLTTSGKDFVAVIAQAPPAATIGLGDIFAVKLKP